MGTNIRYILLTALRDRLFFGVCALIVLSTYVAYVMGGTALVEMRETTLVFTAGAAELILVVGLVVFICFHLRQAFDSKEIDVILSRPISRTTLVLSFAAGFAVVASLLLAPLLAIIAWLGVTQWHGFIVWSLSLLAELLLISTLAVFAALMLKSAVSAVMGTLAMYVMSRLMGYFIATAKSGLLFDVQAVNMVGKSIINYVAILVPRLDMFAKTEWLIYGVPSAQDIWLFSLQTAIFIPLLLVAAVVDFRRKQF